MNEVAVDYSLNNSKYIKFCSSGPIYLHNKEMEFRISYCKQ